MTPVDYDFMPPVVKAGQEIPFNVPDWTELRLIPGGGNAASAYTRGINGGVGADPLAGEYVSVRFCITGPGQARLASWRYTPSAVWTYSDPVIPAGPPYGPQNLGVDWKVGLNDLLTFRQYHQFCVQVKGQGILYMARLEVVWR